MELALYADGCGYYAGGERRVGRAGDFFTGVSVGPALGMVMARHCLAVWRSMGEPENFDIVEQGANDGALAGDVLAALEGSGLAAGVRYRIVEPLPALCTIQKASLGADERVDWVESIASAPEFTGIHISNELVDALPFHIVRAKEDGWDELFVGLDDGEFRFIARPPSGAIRDMVDRLPARQPGYLAELRPSAEAWIASVAGKLLRGCVTVIDYGMESARLLDPSRARGTFRAYEGHRCDDDILARPGSRDLTAHVDFSALSEAANRAGLVSSGLTDQYHFVIRTMADWLRDQDGREPDQLMRGIKMLMHPSTMGTRFRVLTLRTPDLPILP